MFTTTLIYSFIKSVGYKKTYHRTYFLALTKHEKQTQLQLCDKFYKTIYPDAALLSLFTF